MFRPVNRGDQVHGDVLSESRMPQRLASPASRRKAMPRSRRGACADLTSFSGMRSCRLPVVYVGVEFDDDVENDLVKAIPCDRIPTVGFIGGLVTGEAYAAPEPPQLRWSLAPIRIRCVTSLRPPRRGAQSKTANRPPRKAHIGAHPPCKRWVHC